MNEVGSVTKAMTADKEPRYTYHKYNDTPAGHATKLWGIYVREPGKQWILCTDMYEWAADGLLEVLRANTAHVWSEAHKTKPWKELPTCTEAHLRLATTREMLEELRTRFMANHLHNATDAVAWLLTGLSETNLNYRTVDE